MPTISRYNSLRNKLVLPFTLLGLGVSVVLSVLAYSIVDDLEERSIRQILQVELEDYRVRRQRNPAALPIDTRLIQGYFLPHPRFAGLPAVLPLARASAGRAEDHRGPPRRQTGHPAGSRRRRPAVCTGARQHRVAGQPRRPGVAADARRRADDHAVHAARPAPGRPDPAPDPLLREITERAQRARWPEDLPPLLSGDYPKNEIGHLAQALDSYAERLRHFVQRERHFVGDVSHELRTPIAIIRSSAEVLAESPDLPPAARERLALIERRSARLSGLLDALLMLARESEGDALRDANAACPIADAVADGRKLIGDKPVELSFEASDRPILPIEPPMAHAVVANLVGNTCIHTRQGRVRITLDGEGFAIEDTGVGIAADRFPDIFRRHVKGKDSPGAGLGLSIVARLTEVMGWTIAIESEEGVGTRVAVRFRSEPPHGAQAA